MLKTSFTFAAACHSRYHHNYHSIKRLAATGGKRSAKQATQHFITVLRNATLPWLKASAVVGIAMAMNVSANAQCNTFQNADAANPLLSVIPAGKKVAGFDFVDIDGDGDLDAYVAFNGETKLAFFRNVGSPTHPQFKAEGNTGFGNLAVACSLPYMQFVDIDGDGDYDFFISTKDYHYYTYPRIVYYENTGNATAAHFVENDADNPVTFAGWFNYIPFAFADMDGDGDYDFYEDELFSYNTNSYPHVWFNDGTKYKANYILYSESFNSDLLYSRTYYDWNRDGLLDYFEADNPFGGYERNVGPKEAPKYINDEAHKPDFHHNTPYRMIDLNNDGAPEIFGYDGSYSVLSPVAIIQDTLAKNGNTTVNKLSSVNQMPGYSYRWEYNGTTLLAATLPYIYATRAGTYTLYVTNECGTGVSLNYVVTKTGVPLEQANDRITAMSNALAAPIEVTSYPNPFTSTFTLQLSSAGGRTESMVRITDLAGRVFLSQRMSASTVELGQRLSQGTYVVQVWQGGVLVYDTIMLKE